MGQIEEDLPGFGLPNKIKGNEDDDSLPKAHKKGKGGGFQSMGLSFPVLKGITKRGYKIPTPIQRKTIPIALEGRDVVAMARTGSGKTACFLVPLFEKLKMRTAKAGARALVLSPTRELALQTLKFIKEIGRFSDLRAAVILGGDSMDHQFSAIHGSPDIIVATPGRFLHICIEMDLKLSSIEYIVFDEADRLFEMGFGEQLREIVNRLPENRQTLLFSATLPKVLVEFARAGLSDPVLIRLDVESKLPNELTLTNITCRPEEKLAVLLVLLKTIIPPEQQTVVFAATRHHVEYLHTILDTAGLTNTYIYSNLDPSARKINAAKFSTGKVQVLVVTDVAARGIDIPQLDNVINYNFPAKSKLFVHRVGRCARAGRTGTAFSIISPEEYPHLLDLYLFLGSPLQILPLAGSSNKSKVDLSNSTQAIGSVPQDLIEEQHTALMTWHGNSNDLENMVGVCNNGYEKYLKSRPAASADSNRRVKDLNINICGIHPIFKPHSSNADEVRQSLLYKMKNYRPQGTIFEICSKNKSNDYVVMKTKRAFHKNNIINHHKRLDSLKEQTIKELNDSIKESTLPESNTNDITDTFRQVIVPKKRKLDDLYKPKQKKQRVMKDEENYIPYMPADRHTEDGLAVNNFVRDADRLQLDLTADTNEQLRLNHQLKKWDRKKMKMVGVQKDKQGKIRTESGVWISATFKSNRYEQWKEKTKVDADEDESDNDAADDNRNKFNQKSTKPIYTHWARHNENVKEKQRKVELKNPDQILKQRQIAEKKKKKQKKPKRNTKRNNQRK